MSDKQGAILGTAVQEKYIVNPLVKRGLKFDDIVQILRKNGCKVNRDKIKDNLLTALKKHYPKESPSVILKPGKDF